LGDLSELPTYDFGCYIKKFVKLIIWQCDFVRGISLADLVMAISITVIANQRTSRGSGGKASDEASRGKNKLFLAQCLVLVQNDLFLISISLINSLMDMSWI
jgi:hypothetical protein